MKIDNIILLDLDGVLIIEAPWRQAQRHEDGWEVFSQRGIERLNEIIDETGYDIVLSSARRTSISIELMNEYFQRRGVKKVIKEYFPDYNEEGKPWLTRKQEIEMFLDEYKPNNYLIIDDDKTLSDLSKEIKSNWIQTQFLIGLT